MRGSPNRGVGLVFVLVALVTALGCTAVATAAASTHQGVVSGRLSTVIVPVPPPSKKALQQAAADRRDPFVRSSAPSPSPAVSLPSAAWSPLGPAPIGPAALKGAGNFGTPNAGRVESPVVLPSGTLAGRIVIGTAGGGIFTSDDNGATWTARSDQAASLAIGAVAIDPSNPNHLIAGTGEAANSGDCYWGSGVLSSTDGGTTWTLQDPGNVFFGSSSSQVAIDPSNSNRMFAATNRGLFVTSNGGTSWAKPTDPSYGTNVDGTVTAVVLNPSTPTIVYVASTDGNTDVKVAKSTDGGATWAAAQTGIPTTLASGFAPIVALAIAASSPTTLYASVGSTGPGAVYKTTNSATSWSQLTGAPDFTGQGYAYGGGTSEQGWYDNVIAVDPTNANHVLAAGIAAVETTDGGTTWTNTNGHNFFTGTNHDHPDHHGLAFRSDGKVLVADDGGLYLYDPSSTSFSDLNGNLNNAQFYANFNEVGGTVLAGMQDNASAQTSSSTLSPWTALPGGDGGSAVITPNAPAVRFITYGNQGISVTTDAFATTFNTITPPYGSAAFTPPFTLAPNSVTPTSPTVYFGADGLWQTTNPTAGSPTWTKVTTSPLGASDLVSAIAVSPTNPNIVYVGYQDGTLQVTTDAGATWTNLPAEPFTDTFITGISVDPTNPKAITASVSYNNTRTQPVPPHVAQFAYTSTVAGGSWTAISGNLPTNAAVAHVIYHQGNLIAATDQGVYGTTTPNGASTTWSLVGTGLPAVQVQDVYADPSTNELYAITHGRGAWKLPAATVTIGPSVSRVSPTDGATGVAGNTNVYAVFDTAMDHASTAGAFTLVRASDHSSVPGSVVFFGDQAPVFTPSTPLAPSTQYTATISTAAMSTTGSHLVAPVSFSFTTASGPSVTRVSPADGATGVLPTGAVYEVFSSAMDKASTQAAFSLASTAGGAPVSGSFTWFGPTAMIFTPNNDLSTGVQYRATVSTAAKDQSGNALSSAKSWMFTTVNHPVIDRVSPAVGQSGVGTGTQTVYVYAVFSEAMDHASTGGAFTLNRTSDNSPVAGHIVWFGDRAPIYETSNALAPNTNYTATIAGTAADQIGRTLGTTFKWQFTTGSSASSSATRWSLAISYARGLSSGPGSSRAYRPQPIQVPKLNIPRGSYPHPLSKSIKRLEYELRAFTARHQH